MGFVIYYLVCTVVSAVMLILVLTLIKQHSALQILFYILVGLADFGYFLIALSGSAGEAVLALKISYASAFLPVFVIMANAQFCKIRLPRILIGALAAANAVLVGLICSIGYSDVYYRSVDIVRERGASFIVKEYGPWHNYYLILLVTETLFSAALVVYAMRRRKKVSFATVIFLAAAFIFNVVIFFGERVLSLSIELIPLSFLVTSILYLLIAYRDQTYKIATGIVSVYEEQKNYVCLSLDSEFRLMDYNRNAEVIYPEICEVRIDTNTFDPDGALYRELIAWIGSMKDSVSVRREMILPKDGRLYKVTARKRPNDQGYVVEMVDDTEFQNNLTLLMKSLQTMKEAEQAALEANRAKSEFLANMSHEIRTPINAIMGMNEMILRKSEDKQITEYAGYIGDAGDALLSLVNDILDFSKIEAGRLEIEEDDYSLGHLLSSVCMMFRSKAEDKKLEFVADVSPDLPDALVGDEKRIRQVLSNLISNAVKYTDAGRIKLTVMGRDISDAETEFCFSVEDTGKGIKAQDLDKLFDSFERFDKVKNRNIEGTGLGLAITKKIVDKMEGRIEVTSIYGEGSRFTVTLTQKVKDRRPVGDWNAAAGKAPEKAPGKKELPVIKAPDMHILAVDDNKVNLLVIKQLLSQCELVLDTAGSGAEAVKKAGAVHYDLILMDHYMPEMDGIEAMKHIKEQYPEYARTPFVCLTANAIQGSEEFYREQGFDAYLSKPIVYEKMIETIETLTEG